MNNNNQYLRRLSKKIFDKKKSFFVLFFLLFFFLVQISGVKNLRADDSLVNGQVGLSQIGGAFGETGSSPRDMKTMVIEVIQAILGLTALLMTILLIYGGFFWMTSAGSEERVKTAKRIITAAVIGLFIIMVSYVITYFVIETTRKTITGSIW